MLTHKRIKDFTEYGFQGYLRPNKINLNVIADRSRLSWFFYRALNKIYSIIQKFTSKEQNVNLDNTTKLYWEEFEFKYYYPKKFIS